MDVDAVGAARGISAVAESTNIVEDLPLTEGATPQNSQLLVPGYTEKANPAPLPIAVDKLNSSSRVLAQNGKLSFVHEP